MRCWCNVFHYAVIALTAVEASTVVTLEIIVITAVVAVVVCLKVYLSSDYVSVCSF